MITHWQLPTQGQPLAAVQRFLIDVFERADLVGLLAPIRPSGTPHVETHFVQVASQLRHADPFAPVMRCNAAKLAALLAQEYPCDRLGAVLRPCEVRALVELDRRDTFDLQRCLIIGVDCVGTFPVQDYAARATFAGGPDALTREVLQFARVGGLGANRYRVACQMCDTQLPDGVDLILDLFGLPTREMILLTVRNEALIDQLRLDVITGGQADPAVVAEYNQAHAAVAARRRANRERYVQALPATLPCNLAELAVHLANRATCHECFKACPLMESDFTVGTDGGTLVQLNHWLDSCVECGMCEQACPRHWALTVEHEHLRHETRETSMAG